MGSGAKSYKRKGFLIHTRMWKYTNIFTIYEEVVIVIYDFAPDPSEFPNFILFFISVEMQ